MKTMQTWWHFSRCEKSAPPLVFCGAARVTNTSQINASEKLTGRARRSDGRRHWQRRQRPASASCPTQAAFTLIEIMVVVVILGILAVTIVPQFIGTTQEAKVSSAKSSVADLETAVERFHMHMDRYPTSEEGLRVLVDPPSADAKNWRGPYIKMVRPDPWGSPYQYKLPGIHHPTTFDIWSRGGDKADGGEGDAADIGNW